ncbi:hypothetical protein M3Y96_01206000 [Aphelenchoides besseyi]|nr:hypothetical protein M3Y96_01206000 [Aphelenchoides besseyi]
MFFFSGGSPAPVESEYGQIDQYVWKDTFEQLTSSLGILTLSAYLSIGTIASFEGEGLLWKVLAFILHHQIGNRKPLRWGCWEAS